VRIVSSAAALRELRGKRLAKKGWGKLQKGKMFRTAKTIPSEELQKGRF